MASDATSPSSATRLPSLAGLRFVCAIAVFTTHAYVSLSFNGDWTGTKATVAMIVGRSALSFFFVLSGFVMTWSARPATPHEPSGVVGPRRSFRPMWSLGSRR